MYYKIIDDKTVYSDGKVLNTEITRGGSTRKVTIINPTEQQMLAGNAGPLGLGKPRNVGSAP